MSAIALPNHSHQNAFDGLRLIAALLVLIGHSYELSGQNDPFNLAFKFETLAATGVILFFAISGFLVSQSMLNSHSFRSFLTKRCLRVFPALWVYVFVAIFLLAPALSSLNYDEFLSQKGSWLYARNAILLYTEKLPSILLTNQLPGPLNGSLWTLNLEFKLYLLLSVCLLLKPKMVKWCLAVYLLAIFALFIKHFWFTPSMSVRFLSQPSMIVLKLMGAFFVGVIFCVWQLQRFLNIFVATLLMIIILSVASLVPNTEPWIWLLWAWVLSYFGLSLGFNLTALLKPITDRGDFSYGLYLWAFPVQQTVLHLLPGITVIHLILISLFATSVLAYISWHFIEKRALALKSKWAA